MKSALNRVLTLPDYRYRRELSIDVLYVTRASICVELWPKQVLHRISVPMSYNSLIGKQKKCSRIVMILKCAFNDSPNKLCLKGFWRNKGLLKGSWLRAALTSTKNVAKTIGFTTFAKINHLWLQREGRSVNAAAATDDLFLQML